MQKQNNETIKYPLSTAGRRILSKAIDIIIVSCIVLALGFTIFCTDSNFKWNEPLILSQKWRYGLFVSLMAVTFFGLLFLLPCLWKKTIGMKALKLSYYKRKEEMNFSLGLFKHELFIWEIIVFLALVMGWVLTFLNQNKIDSLLAGSMSIFASTVPEGLDKACYYVGTGFSCFYGLAFIFLIAIIVATCIKNHRPAFHDKYSNIYVISLKTEDVTKTTSKKHTYENSENDFPGVISNESFEEIENL